MPEKVIAGVKYIFSEWPTVKGIFKIDDDVEIVNMAKFIINAINMISDKVQYAGITTSVNYKVSNHHIGKCHNTQLNISLPLNPNITYCGGPLYFLGQESIKLISTSTDYLINTIYEDNLMGYILRKYGNITPIANSLYYNLDDLIKPKNKRPPPPISHILTIHNNNHNDNLLMHYFQKVNFPILPNGFNVISPEFTSELDSQISIDGISDENINFQEFEIFDDNHQEPSLSSQRNQLNHNYKQIPNQYAIRKRLNFLLHRNSISNYITVHGGLCNNFFQISAAWHYGLLGHGYFIRCFAGGINHKQLTDDITSYYQTYLFPENRSIPTRDKINHKPKYIDLAQSCFEYLGPIYDPAKIIIHKDYFQHMDYINTFRIDTVWRHIVGISRADDLFQKHNKIDWHHHQNFYSVHIRLGDYLQSSIHNIDYSGQIHRLITELLSAPDNTDARFIFFTDDYDLLAQNINKYFPLAEECIHRYSIINEPDPLNTLRLMSVCSKGHILSNSSFSIWGAILNTNTEKQVYLPRKWLNSADGDDITEAFKNISVNQVFY